MLRLSKLTDYATVLLSYPATENLCGSFTARDLSEWSRVPLPTVGKILRMLSRAGLLTSTRGVKGGYRLARDPAHISVAEIVSAMEGPIALTECGRSTSVFCDLEASCPVRCSWKTISGVVRKALEDVSLQELALGASSSSGDDIVKEARHIEIDMDSASF